MKFNLTKNKIYFQISSDKLVQNISIHGTVDTIQHLNSVFKQCHDQNSLIG